MSIYNVKGLFNFNLCVWVALIIVSIGFLNKDVLDEIFQVCFIYLKYSIDKSKKF